MSEPTTSENETFYDTEIAPELLRLGRLLQARGMRMLAVVEYDPGDFGETNIGVTESLALTMAWLAQRCHGNVDQFMISVAQHITREGIPHGSIALKQWGVDPSPDRRGTKS